MSEAWFERPVLSGRYVRLEPLSLDHVEGLFEAGKDPDIWTWLSEDQPTDVNGMRAIVERALAAREQGIRLPWVQIDAVTEEVAGTTSFYDLDPGNRGLAIGYTWIGARWHRTGINTESKLMLLERAFGDLDAIRVAWHTHSHNERSRRAIQRLGAQFEGVHRNHRVRQDGSFRDTATFSMIDSEWPAAREALRAKLDR